MHKLTTAARIALPAALGCAARCNGALSDVLGRWQRGIARAMLLTGALAGMTLCASAYAQIAFRAASQASSPVGQLAPNFQAAGAAVSSAGTVTPAWPAHAIGDVALLFVESTGGQAATLSTAAGFVAVANSPQATGAGTAGTRITVFWARATSAAMTAPTVADPGNHVYAQILTYRGVIAAGNPWDVTGGGVKAGASTAVTVTGVTTTVPNTRIVQAVARDLDSAAAAFSAQTNANLTGITERSDGGTTQGNGGGFGVWDGVMAIAAATGSTTATVTNSVNAFLTVALRPPDSVLTINVPAGTLANDVMIASVIYRPCSNASGAACTTTITPPAGWTQVNTMTDQTTGGGTGGFGNRLFVYQRVATGAEPANYTWTFGGQIVHAGAVGGILSFSGVNTTTPVVAQAGSLTASATSHTAPSVALGGVAGAMLVTSHSANSSATWTAPAGMASRVNAASLGAPNDLGLNLQVNTLPNAPDPTLARTASWTSPPATDTGDTHTLALRPLGADHFAVIAAAGAPDTCVPKNVTITAQDVANATVTSYTGTINITTSSVHGNWSLVTGAGTLTPGAADSGSASYTFAAADNGVVTLALANSHADDLTVNVVDSTQALTSSTSATLAFRSNLFVIVEDPIQVAGRNQAMTVRMMAGAACAVATTYTGVKNLDAWLTRDAADPGGAAPTIGALSLPNAAPAVNPASNNLSLTFTNGVATFNLSTTDVGKYVLSIRDDTRLFATGSDIAGSSVSLTTRPFALGFTAIQQGALANPGGTSGAGAKFVAAEDTFQATVGAYLWSAADDVNNDGVPDVGANVTNNGLTPSFRWATTLSATTPITPAAGITGALGGTVNIPLASFAGGAATVANLTYSQVGSMTLRADATKYLGSLFNPSGTSTPVGRFYPDHFALTASAVAAACNGFTYMGQGALNVSYTLQAQGRNNGVTSNYSAALGYPVAAVALVAENANAGIDLGPRMTLTAATWAAGSYAVASPNSTFARLAAPDGPYDLLAIGIRAVDADGAVIANRDLNAATNTNCVAALNCDAKQIGGATTRIRFGRLRLGNANGSQLIAMPIPIEAQYWNGTAFVTNTADTCTTIAAANVALGNYQGNLNAGETTVTTAGAFNAGIGTLRLSAPGAGNNGSVDVSVNLTAAAAGASCTAAMPGSTGSGFAWLQGAWCSATYNRDPTSRATFGVFRNTDKFIYQRENF